MQGATAIKMRRKSAVERLELQLTQYNMRIAEIKEQLKTARNHKDKAMEAEQLVLLSLAETKQGRCKITLDNTNLNLKNTIV